MADSMGKPPIMLIGESPGATEARTGVSFVGPSGAELLRLLNESGIIEFTAADAQFFRDFYQNGDAMSLNSVWNLHADSVFRTNVFSSHPPGNNLEAFCGTKKEGITGWPALTGSKYLLPEYAHELDALDDTIRRINPNLIVALGNTPLWATCGAAKISKVRGTTRTATHIGAGRKVLPIFHPAAVLRDYSLRPLTIIDFTKAKRESEFPDVRRPAREIWIEPSLEDIQVFIDNHIRNCELLSVDIETSGTRVTCIGFAPQRDLALVVPFDDEREKNRSYWPSEQHERSAWYLVKSILEDRTIPKLFQNGLYDIGFLLRAMGIAVRGAVHDTMLLHHALMPEAQKGLGFLGSIYTDEGAWKTERKIAATEYKRDA